MAEALTLEGRFLSYSEGGAFYATSNDRGALDALAVLLGAVAADGNRLRHLMEYAKTSGFEFGDRARYGHSERADRR
nr:hypothetical protein [Micromonospora viridifaciens]